MESTQILAAILECDVMSIQPWAIINDKLQINLLICQWVITTYIQKGTKK